MFRDFNTSLTTLSGLSITQRESCLFMLYSNRPLLCLLTMDITLLLSVFKINISANARCNTYGIKMLLSCLY